MKNLLFILTLLFLFPHRAFSAKCIINEDMVFIIDGKKVFPIGFTMPPPPEGKTPSGKNAIDELHEAGATFLRTGVMGTNWDEATFDLPSSSWDNSSKRLNRGWDSMALTTSSDSLLRMSA